MLDLLNKLKFGKGNEFEDEEKLEEGLQFLEEILNEEDPEFMKSVGELTIEDPPPIEPEEIESDEPPRSAMTRFKDAYSGLFVAAENRSPLLGLLLRPVMMHRYPKQALGFWVLLAGLGYGGFKLYQAHFWHQPTQLFLTSYAALGLTVHDYDMLEQVEPYYDNVRLSKNIMSLIKMTANIRPSANSSNNPMISFEIIIQGVSNDPIVEIKDREAEFRALILRATEDFTYDDLETATGKQQLSDAILAKINANLTDGQIRKVYYKNFVIKP